MSSLIRFELKKMFFRRVTLVSCMFVFAMLVVIAITNINSQYAPNPDDLNSDLIGTAAISQIKSNEEALAGPITNEKATEVIRQYQTFLDPNGELKEEFVYRGGVPDSYVDEYWRFRAVTNSYLNLLTKTWSVGYSLPASVATTIDTSQTVDLYGQINAKIESELDDSPDGLNYTSAEKAFWLDKAKGVFTPIEYGYAGGWEDFLSMTQFLIFALLAMAITCASVFNGEYSSKTDALILSTKYGKTRLGRAKVAAAFIGASIVYWAAVLILLVVCLIFFGSQGAGLAIQMISLSNTYSISLLEASLICCLVGYLATLALLGIILVLSARMRSPMGILAVAVAIVLIPLFIPNLSNNVANHIVFLFPYYVLDPHNLFDMISYAVGPVVIEYPVFCAILYALLFIMGAVLSMRSFRNHQIT